MVRFGEHLRLSRDRITHVGDNVLVPVLLKHVETVLHLLNNTTEDFSTYCLMYQRNLAIDNNQIVTKNKELLLSSD